MVEKKAVSYVTSVKEDLHGDPAKIEDFHKLLADFKTKRVDLFNYIARAGELLKDHPNLLSGLNVFLPDQANIFIPPEPELPDNIQRKHDDAKLNKIKVNPNNMVGNLVAAKPTVDDAYSYVTAVQKAFHGELAKFIDFLNLFCGLSSKRSLYRVDPDSLHARVGELFKDHPNLISGLNDFLPAEAKIIVPPEPEQPTDDPLTYIFSVKEALHDETAKYKDFLKLLDDHLNRRVVQASFVSMAKQIFKNHPNLVPGLSVLLPDQSNIFGIIPPEPEKPIEQPDHIKRRLEEAESFVNKIKKRFQTCDTHVPKAFLKIMNEFKERKKSEEEVREEVIDLIYYHEDLRAEFLKCLQ